MEKARDNALEIFSVLSRALSFLSSMNQVIPNKSQSDSAVMQ